MDGSAEKEDETVIGPVRHVQSAEYEEIVLSDEEQYAKTSTSFPVRHFYDSWIRRMSTLATITSALLAVRQLRSP
jgi:hypothetical protein